MKTPIFKIPFFALAIVAMFLFAACDKTENEMALPKHQAANELSNPDNPNSTESVSDRSNGNSKVFPPTAHPGGLSYTEWTEVWLQQFYTYDCESVPFLHPENVLFYENGPVYIMAGISEEGGEANVTIPRGKAVLFPLVNFWWDLCPGELPDGVTTEDYLTQNIASLMANVDEPSLSVTVDGEDVSNLASYKVTTGVYEFTGNPVLAGCFDPCVTGEPQPVASGGYYIILKPMSPGQHTLHYHSEVPPFGMVQDATFNITVP